MFTKFYKKTTKGNPLLLDFFLDDEDGLGETLSGKTTSAPEPAKSEHKDVSGSMNSLKNLLSAEMVKKVNGVYAFKITDANPSEWYLDLKNGNGQIDSGAFNGQANCTMTMSSDVFNNMVSGSLKPTMAFMSGKLKIKGDMGLAMKLEKLMASVKSKL